MKNVLILEKKDVYEVWGSLTEMCDAHGELKYHSLKSIKVFPIEMAGFKIVKVPYKVKLIED